MYRLIIESLLGLSLETDKLHIEPCLPDDWEMLKVHYRYRETTYHITIMPKLDSNREIQIIADGVELHDKAIPLIDDHKEHSVEVRIMQCGSPALSG